MPHEIQFDAAGHLYIAERDNHVSAKSTAKTGVDLDVRRHRRRRVLRRRRAGEPRPTASAAQHRRGSRRAAADLRHRQSPHPASRSRDRHHRDVRRHGRARSRRLTARRCSGTPLNGPRTIAFDRARRPVSRAARGQRDLPDRRARPRRSITSPAPASRDIGRRRAGARGANSAGPKGLAWSAGSAVRGRHRESRHPPNRPRDRRHHDVLGTGRARRRA